MSPLPPTDSLPTVLHLLHRQAQTSPTAIALVTPSGETSYAELAYQIAQLSDYLRATVPALSQTATPKADIPPRIAIHYPPSEHLVVGLLGVLASGACAVPLAANAPAERLSLLLQDADPELLLTAATEFNLPAKEELEHADLATVMAQHRANRQQAHQPASTFARPSDAAIAIYTSGTTGAPKAVLMKHQGFANMANVHRSAFDLQVGKRALIYGSPVHGNWINSLLVALANGATAVIETEARLLPGPDLLNVLQDKEITHVHMPPSSLAALPKASLPALEVLTLGGESLPGDILTPWLEQLRIFNCYGATESNWLSFAEITTQNVAELTIGAPMVGMRAQLVTSNLHPVDEGQVGELIMSGIGVAQGYLNDAALTQQRFIQHEGAIWYRSGDLARLRNDGQYQIIGRNDAQLSIRGYRIEPSEIENTLIKHPLIAQAAVHGATSHRGTSALLAVLVLNRNQVLMLEELRDWLAELLPAYMIPARFRVTDSLPLLPNGKLNRRAVEDLQGTALPSLRGSGQPVSSIERAIAALWTVYTGDPNPYLDSDFFASGGDSIGAVKFLWEVSEKYLISLPTGAFLLEPTLGDLAKSVTEAMVATETTTKARALSKTQPDTGVVLTKAPLSATQQRLWLISRYAPEPALYNVPYLLELTGPVKPEIIESALRSIIQRHLPLRSRISIEAGQLLQEVAPDSHNISNPFCLTRVDVSTASVDEKQGSSKEIAEQLISDEANRAFDFTAELTPRATLVSTTPEHHQLIIVLHHVVCDGWSVANLFRELSILYNAAVAALPAEVTTSSQTNLLPHLPTSYFEYTTRVSRDQAIAANRSHWQRHLHGSPTRIRLPTDFENPAQEDYAGATLNRYLPPDLAEQVERLAAHYAVTPTAIFLSAYYILLYRSGAGNDLTIGVPLIGHDQSDTKNLIGLFASVVPQRCILKRDTLIADLVTGVNQNLRLAIAHQHLPLDTIEPECSQTSTPMPARLLQSVFSHQNVMHHTDIDLHGLTTAVTPVFPATAKFELMFNVERIATGWQVFAEYRTALFDASTIEQLLINYNSILDSLATDEPQTVAAIHPAIKLPQQSAGTRPTVLKKLPSEHCIHELFEQQCARDPGAIALRWEQETLSYQALNEQANYFADCLLGRGIQPSSVIGICMPRASATLIAMLGILKAGCAYLPLPTDYPDERLTHMVNEARANLVITQAERTTPCDPMTPEVTYEDLLANATPSTQPGHADTSTSANSLAYVMYTSGTSGTPSPVAVPHRGVVRLAKDPDYVKLNGDTKLLQLAPLAFDASTFEIWGAWLNGGCCVLYPEALTHLGRLADTISQHGVNTLWLTASLFNAVVDENVTALQGVDQLLIGGEALSVQHVSRAQTALRDLQIINGYGPTECTTFACTYRLPKNWNSRRLRVPIGKPIQHTQTLILDDRERPVAPGLVGELYLSGAGLALGYLHRPELTEQRFVRIRSDGQSVIAYKTGDLVKEQTDGNLQFLGRADQQLKIRGYRVEPQQIEHTLLGDPAVNRAAIVVRKTHHGNSLIATIESNETANSKTLQSIRARVNSRLADFERPWEYLLVDQLPTTENGKTDRAQLLLDIDEVLSNRIVRPADGLNTTENPTETWIVSLWEELLNYSTIQPTDNFFDLGGNSLLAIRCMERIRQTFATELPLSLLFEAGTARQLAEVLVNSPPSNADWSPLVHIRAASAATGRRNLFLVHALGGEVLGFSDFARYLDNSLNLYALEARGALKGQQPHTNLAVMAAEYIDELRRVQPTGPYRLGGISMGGLVAHEMAIQLSAAGHEVDYILVGDTWYFSNQQLSWLARLRYWGKIAKHAPTLLRQWVGNRSKQGINKANTRHDPIEKSAKRVAMLNAHHEAIDGHIPAVCPGRVTLIRANKLSRARLRDEAAFGSSAMGWGELATDGVEEIVLGGDHSTIFYAEGAKQFANEINRSMPEAQEITSD